MNRIVRGADFRATMRSGRRVPADCSVVYLRATAPAAPTRFGFIVSKAVGPAVTRNLVSRRLRAICRGALEERPTGSDVVVRALPGIAEVPWEQLRSSILRATGARR
ncbi:MAG: ribonuclease P protein component [Microbacteriaceae bacterium]